MQKLMDIFKDSGLNNLIEEIQKRIDNDQLAIKELTRKLEMLELLIDFNSAIYVQSGASIEAVEMLGTFKWRADDVSEFVTGLDALTYDDDKPTRWASSKSKSVKISIPLSRNEEKKLTIRFSGGINQNVLSSLKIFIDGKKTNLNLTKDSGNYVFTSILNDNYSGINSIVNIEYQDFVEGKDRHTIGLCSVEIV
jgi:hypothetical protein